MLDPGDFYFEDGLMVLTERYHRKRGSCCGNGCRHCPYGHVSVERAYVDVNADDPSAPREVPLAGGDVTEGVVRVGATVRRPRGRQSAAIHAFLDHLERSGFTGAPRFLGIDARGREVLTFVDGEMGGRPLHAWAATDAVVAAVARLQRRFHDCAAGFTVPEGIAWMAPLEIAGVPPPYDGPELIGHNDLTPENIIFVARDGSGTREPVALIDFDLAGPTTRLLDVVNAMTWWCPLRDPIDRDPLLRDADAGRRMRSYADAYGLDAPSRDRILDVAERRYERSWHVMKYRAEHDGGGWARMWAAGVGDVIRRSAEWLRRERAHLEAELRRTS